MLVNFDCLFAPVRKLIEISCVQENYYYHMVLL